MRSITFIALAIVITGCASARHANLDGLTTDREKHGTYRTVGSPVERTSCTTWFALMFFGDGTGPERLVEEVLKQRSADILVNARMRSTHYGMPPFLSRHCRTVTGQPAVWLPGKAPGSKES